MSRLGEGKVLIIADDSLLMQRIYSAKLSKLGYIIHFAFNGEEAARLYASTPLVHAVILDFHMEGSSGLDGARLIREISHSRKQSVRVILVSGSTHDGGTMVDFDVIFEKPVNWNALAASLER